MASQISAGVLMYRREGDRLEVLIAHPGGPYWAKKDDGAWSIPKGLIDEGEDAKAAAVREFVEETGCELSVDDVVHLGEVTLKSGKRVIAYATEGDCDPDSISSNFFEMEWPPRSGHIASFPEIDRIEWVDPATAMTKLNPAQAVLVAALVDLVTENGH